MTTKDWQHAPMLGRFDDIHAFPASITDHHSADCYRPHMTLRGRRGQALRSRRALHENRGCNGGRHA